MRPAGLFKSRERRYILSFKYYDGNNLKSNTDADMYISIGGRGIGKTFWWKRDNVKRFIEHGEQWIYLRRYNSELSNIDLLLDDIAHEFPDWEFEIKKKRMFAKLKTENKWKEMGFIMCLSRIKTGKGVNYPNVGTILYDEFQLDDSDKRLNKYLANEVKVFSDFYETVSRTRNVRIVFLSNAISVVNPYFTKWKLMPTKNKITKKNMNGFVFALEMCNADEYMAEKRKTRSGRLMEISGMAESSLQNEMLNDNLFYIAKKPPNAKYKFNLKIDGQYIGVYQDPTDWKLYFAREHTPTGITYVFKKSDIDEKSYFVKSKRDYNDISIIVNLFHRNLVSFANQNIKYNVLEILSLLNVL